MANYSVGQHVALRSGKVGTIKAILQDHSMAHLTRYQIKLTDSQQLLGVNGVDVMHLVGPQAVRISPTQQIVIQPRMTTQMQLSWLNAIKGAFTDSWQRLTQCLIKVQQLSNGMKATGASVLLQDIVYCTFRVPYDDTRGAREDYIRLFGYLNDVLQALIKGLHEDRLILAEIAAQYQVRPEGGTVGGYVMAGPLERLSMWWYGDDHRIHGSSQKITPLDSPIHLNFVQLVPKPFLLTQTLIHEATHKFCRTVDHVYLPETLLRNMAGPRAMAGIMNVSPFEAMDKAIASATDGSNIVAMTPKNALNNADSYAWFIMWLTENIHQV